VLAVIERLKADAATRRIPVVALTSGIGRVAKVSGDYLMPL